MFTGIVEETGKVLVFEEGGEAYRLTVRTDKIQDGMALGDSVAVNGCCLTVIAYDSESVTFELLGETVRLTSFNELAAGAGVNLERSLRFNGKIGGHFVSGHIDTLGQVEILEKRGKDYYLRVAPPPEYMRYLIYKGSIAIDGISLTVAEVDDAGFSVWLIPHTMQATNFNERQVGQHVNLEFDLLGKYVEKLLPDRAPAIP